MNRREYSISLSITGREFDPSIVSDIIQIEPDTCCKEGDPIKTPIGRIVNDEHEYSIWRKNFNFPLSADGCESLDTVVSFAEKFRKKSEESIITFSIDIFFSLYGRKHFGFMDRHNLMKRMTDAGINFGFEIFPDVN